jgi:hypothetical protein
VTARFGPGWYWETAGIGLAERHNVAMKAFYEDGTVEMAQIENPSTGDGVTPRDKTAPPLWAAAAAVVEEALCGASAKH